MVVEGLRNAPGCHLHDFLLAVGDDVRCVC